MAAAAAVAVTTAGDNLAPAVLFPAQRQARLFTDVANQEASITELADSMLTSLDDDNTLPRPLLDRYTQECYQILAELSGSLVTLYSNREESDPVNWERHNLSATKFIMGIKRKVQLIKREIAIRGPTGRVIEFEKEWQELQLLT